MTKRFTVPPPSKVQASRSICPFPCTEVTTLRMVHVHVLSSALSSFDEGSMGAEAAQDIREVPDFCA